MLPNFTSRNCAVVSAATIQTLSKDDVLSTFKPDEFDYIVYDEVHRIGASSYQKLYNYFKPKFILGMTATPERSDGLDIYKFFDYNIAYEIRLQEAMEENLISPFHYYGVSELIVDGKVIEDKDDFNKLIDSNRVTHIIDKIERYGYCGNRVKGLIFVSRKEEAIKLSQLFNERGYRTVALTGLDSQTRREECVNKLEQESWSDGLDYIFTVDIFNEGIDIPAVNQIVMLRPTESAIIFIQQLGRGLRRFKNKDYVVVIDFIGNYEKNFLIPIALSGDNTYNKDNIRRFINEGNNILPGASTVNFEKVVKDRIFESIDNAKFNDLKIIKDSYFNLKAKLGKIPSLRDFSNFGAIDIMRIVARDDSYYSFLKKYDKEYSVCLNEDEKLYLDFVTSKYLSGKRPHELELLKCIIDGENIWKSFTEIMTKKYPILKIDNNTKINLLNQLTQKYIEGVAAKKYEDAIVLEVNEDIISINNKFKSCLDNNEFKTLILEVIDYGLERNSLLFGDRYKDMAFKLYEKYTYDDVFRLLDWHKSEVALNVGGYKYEEKTNTFPVFINYKKDEDISDTIKYNDHFITPNLLKAISKGSRTLLSPEIVALQNALDSKLNINLFVRRNKDDKESKEFYYLGKLEPTNQYSEFMMDNTNKTAVEIGYKLEDAVREDIYDFLTN